MVYIDLNMVRAGAVSNPEEWRWSGYYEIQNPAQRYAVIDTYALLKLSGVLQLEKYQQLQKGRVEAAQRAEENQRLTAWTQNLAVGRQEYITKVKSDLGLAGKHREVVTDNDLYTLKEPVSTYRVHLGYEKRALIGDNTVFLK